MFALEPIAATPGKMEARKELRMHRADEARIRAAAAATGLQEADFIRQAALLRAGSRATYGFVHPTGGGLKLSGPQLQPQAKLRPDWHRR
jgi:hypothetical protein